MSAISAYPQRHAISSDEHLRMAKAGVFAMDVRLELMEGEIIEMAPIGSAHAAIVNSLSALLHRLCGEHAIVSVRNPIVAGDRSVPQPDIALLKARSDGYFHEHPTAADVLLVIEVSDTTLRFDLERKALLYAVAGVPETWVVDLDQRSLHVLRDPSASGYRTGSIERGNDLVAATTISAVQFELASIFPPR